MYISKQDHGRIGYNDQILRTKKKILHIFHPSIQILILIFNTCTWTFYFVLFILTSDWLTTLQIKYSISHQGIFVNSYMQMWKLAILFWIAHVFQTREIGVVSIKQEWKKERRTFECHSAWLIDSICIWMAQTEI